MPRGATCSLTSKAITIVGGSTQRSAISPQSRQTAKPHNLVSTFPGEGQGDGTADERQGDYAARGAARFGSAKADAGSGGPPVGAGAASGISAFKELSGRRCGRL